MNLLKTDQGASDQNERQVDIGTALISNAKAPVFVQPGMSSFHDPTMSAELLATIDASPCYARCYPAFAKRLSAFSVVVAFVRMQLLRAESWSAPLATANSRDRINGGFEHYAIVNVGSRQHNAQRRSKPIYHKMALRALFAAIRRRWPSRFTAPFFASGAGTLAESALARDQSILSACESLSRQRACSSAQTPAVCQSRRRRQQVMPEPHPIS